MADWFASWFNSDEYLQVYKNRDSNDASKLVELILQNINLEKNATILDLACGSGRHSILFAQLGYKVTGIDLSENLLSIAKDNSALLNLKIEFIRKDIRKLKLNSNFNLVLNLFTSFGYFDTDDENFNIFSIAYNHLVGNGFFIFDFLNSKYVINNLVPYSKEIINNKEVIQERRIENNKILKKILIASDGITKQFCESVNLYNSNSLIQNITERGFKIQSIFGNYSGELFNELNSLRFIAICKK